MLDAILLPIAEGNRVLRQIRGGDLREKVEVECQGDHQKMKEAVNGVHGWLVDLVAYVTSIANGDLTANVAKASNNDQIHEWLVLVKNNIAALVADAGMLSRAAVEGKLSTRADAFRHQGDYRKIVQGVNETLDAVIGPLNVAAEYVDRISKGDIPPKITDSYSGDFNEIKNNLNQAIEAVNALVADARMLSQAAVEGKLATRADASKHQGDFRAIVQGVNDCLDSVIGPLNVAAKYVERISKGDIPSVISDNYNGDFNEIKVNLNVLINAMQTVTNAAAQIALGNLSVEVHERSPQDQLMQALTRMVATLRELAKTAEQIADGDLTVNVKTASENDAIGNAFATMVTNLRGIVGNVGTSSDSIASATRQIATGNSDLAQRTETQASSLEEIASSMEELTSTVKQNADNSQQANQLAIDASDVAVKGGQVINRVVDTMDSISSSSKKIADIISVIDGIAFQTNILALNAAVEAARAGEQGRGFAVVAGEVRNLAQRSAAAAKEIKELIGDSVDKVGNGSKLVGEAGQTMQEIVTSIKRVTDIMGEISAASVEQSSGIEQVNIAINSLDEITQQNASVVQEASSAAAALEEQAHLLVEAVNRFKLDEQSRVTQHEIARLQRLDPLQQQSQAALRAGGSSTREIKKVAQSNGYHATKPLKGQLSAKAVGSDADWNDF
jgi:methyl-accepting chemotaxis protein